MGRVSVRVYRKKTRHARRTQDTRRGGDTYGDGVVVVGHPADLGGHAIGGVGHDRHVADSAEAHARRTEAVAGDAPDRIALAPPGTAHAPHTHSRTRVRRRTNVHIRPARHGGGVPLLVVVGLVEAQGRTRRIVDPRATVGCRAVAVVACAGRVLSIYKYKDKDNK